MSQVEVVVALLACATLVAIAARRLTVPYPVLLVAGGLVLALVPGLPTVELDPDVVFLLLLPPLLFFPAVTTSLRDFRANARAVGSLAVALVLVTTLVVGVVVHALVPGIPWAVAFTLGAIVAPPDAVAATAVARRLGLPRRIVTILEGESLVNDAAALVAYQVAVVAVTTGTFSLLDAGVEFVVAGAGGVAVGLVLGWLLGLSARRLDLDPVLDNTLFLLTPFGAYIVAEHLHVSGVLAVVAAGLYSTRSSAVAVSTETRLQGYATVELLSFVLTSLVFVLIGLQLRPTLDALREEGRSLGDVVGYGAAVAATVVVVRLLWVWPSAYLPRWASRRIRERDPAPPARWLVVIGWTGMRGVVSLAAALALPETTADGEPFPERALVLFVAFCVILATLLLQGLTLPPVIRALGVHDDGGGEREEVRARVAVAEAALRRLDELAGEDWVRDDTARRVRGLYEYRRRRFGNRLAGLDGDGGDDEVERRSGDYQRLVRALLDAQRDRAVALRDSGEIGDDALRAIQRDLDLERARLA